MENQSEEKSQVQLASPKKYAIITYEDRVKLIQMIQNGSKIVHAANQLGIKHTTGCLINRNYQLYGRIFNKSVPYQRPNRSNLQERNKINRQECQEQQLNLRLPPQPEIKQEENNADGQNYQVPTSLSEREVTSPVRQSYGADYYMFPNYYPQLGYYIQTPYYAQQLPNPYLSSYLSPQWYYYG